jgi:2'-hydroxyisoflavone reductase
VKILMIGGTRFSGRALTGMALEHGHDVTVLHHGGGPEDPWPDAEHVHRDRADGFDGLTGRAFDAVVDSCGYVPREVRDAGDVFANVGRYCFYSSLSAHRDDVRPFATEDDDVYGPPFPDTEEITDETYGPLKVACEQEVQARFGERALVIRPGYIVGPHDQSDRFTYWVRRGARGGEIVAPGVSSDPLQWVDARDLAAFILLLIEEGTTGTYSVVDPPGATTMAQLLEASMAAGGAEGSIVWVGRGFAEAHGLRDDPTVPLPLWEPQAPNFNLFDTGRAVAAGLRTRSLEETVRDTLAWDEERGSPPLKVGLTVERERELLDAWHSA